MPEDEQIERNTAMQARLRRYNVTRWANDFIHALDEIVQDQQRLSVTKLTSVQIAQIIKHFKNSKKRLLLLDYDGTLVGFKGKPAKAGPDLEMLEILKGLVADKKNEVVIISGRDKTTLTNWLGRLNTSLVAEHGAWIKENNGEWICADLTHNDWKRQVRPIMELYTDRTPGSMVEEKDFSLVWHCRQAEPQQAYIRTQELRDTLMNLTANMEVGVFEGNKILEVKYHGINKGRAAKIWLQKNNWDFILCAGDDYTDEEMFEVLPNSAYSIKVGLSLSRAKFNIPSVTELRELLKRLRE